jgi:hypothetical protein
MAIEGVFELQDKIALSVAGIKSALLRPDTPLRRAADVSGAHDLYLRALLMILQTRKINFRGSGIV